MLCFVFSDDDDDDDEDDTEALLAELEQIKKERAEDKLRKVSIFDLKYNPICLSCITWGFKSGL